MRQELDHGHQCTDGEVLRKPGNELLVEKVASP